MSIPTDSKGRSALHIACLAGVPQAATAYLAAGYSLELKDIDGKTPLELTSSEDVRRAARSFISQQASTEAANRSLAKRNRRI